MTSDALKRTFFDSIAPHWEGWMDVATVRRRLREWLRAFDLQADETVLDLGCGTGLLTGVLMEELGPQGRILAMDFSESMLRLAAAKQLPENVYWIRADAHSLPLPASAVDRIICYSAWPHFSAPGRAAEELGRVLRPGGRLHIWHTDSREKINRVHGDCVAPISGDLLPPAKELASLLEGRGFRIEAWRDSPEEYLILALK